VNIKNLGILLVLGLQLILSACSSSGDDIGFTPDDVSINYPYLKSTPQVEFSENVNTPGEYDVTVMLEADGPAGVQQIHMWITPGDGSTFYPVVLQSTDGISWIGSTISSFVTVPPGHYFIGPIELKDHIQFTQGLHRTSFYDASDFTDTHYSIYQESLLIDLANPDEFVDSNTGTSNIPVIKLTLP